MEAAVLAAEIAEIVTSELDFTLDAVEFYTCSRVIWDISITRQDVSMCTSATECSVSGRFQAHHNGIMFLQSITLQTMLLAPYQQTC